MLRSAEGHELRAGTGIVRVGSKMGRCEDQPTSTNLFFVRDRGPGSVGGRSGPSGGVGRGND